jgi:hypothetical protein
MPRLREVLVVTATAAAAIAAIALGLIWMDELGTVQEPGAWPSLWKRLMSVGAEGTMGREALKAWAGLAVGLAGVTPFAVWFWFSVPKFFRDRAPGDVPPDDRPRSART